MQPYLMGTDGHAKRKKNERKITITTKTNKKILLITFSKTCSFSNYLLFEIAKIECF